MGYYTQDTGRKMDPPYPDRPFQVNDIVRLARGYTPMTISKISPKGMITAYYGVQTFDPAGEEYPDVPTAHYSRPAEGFAWWDGDYIPNRNLPMAQTRRFTVNNRSSMDVGILTGYSSNGLPILEFANGEITAFAQDQITEVKPFTFTVRWGNNTVANFSFSDPDKRVSKGDVLISEDNHICTVTAVDTNHQRPGIFSGRKVLTAEI